MTDTDLQEWYSDDIATFGDRLAAAREAAALSQKDLAKRLGVKLGTLRNWEDDLNEPRANKLQMLSGILAVSMRWLLTGEGDGLDAPEGGLMDPVEAGDIRDILTDMRGLRAQMVQNVERMAQLEKRLRAVLRDSA